MYTQIIRKINESHVIVIDTYSRLNEEYIIVCFEKQLIIINRSNQFLIQTIFSSNNEDKVYFVTNSQSNFQHHHDKPSQYNNFKEEIEQFKKYFDKYPLYSEITSIQCFWEIIRPCIFAYLIKKSYFENNKDRINDFINKNGQINEPKTFDEDEFIYLRQITGSNSSNIGLYYHITSEKIYAVKKFFGDEAQKLKNREIDGNLNFPFTLRYYGHFDDDVYGKLLVIEYMDGQTIEDLLKNRISQIQKYKIILEILSTFQYLHDNNFIYRDLKPNNLLFDQNNRIVLIDFDRMIKSGTEFVNNEFTTDFNSQFIDSEIINGNAQPSFRNDIFSIGKMIYYIFFGKPESKQNLKIFKEKCPQIHDIYSKCTNENERPSIEDVIISFIRIIYNTGDITYIYSVLSLQTIFEFSYMTNKNEPNLLNKLGIDYYKGKYIQQDINKAIHYFTLAANQNHSVAQSNLGIIYYNKKYVPQDIKKAIHYFKLAANNNDLYAHSYLGEIYYKSEYIQQDIGKAIHYLLPLAKQVYSGISFKIDHYIETSEKINDNIIIAANIGIPEAQYILSYSSLLSDVGQKIHYLILAANQDFPDALIDLGSRYLLGQYVQQDVQKGISLITKAANKNDSQAQYELGKILIKGKFCERNIQKGIEYIKRAANQVNLDALYHLGSIYYDGEFVKQDTNMAITYLSIAANNKKVDAINLLGVIYYEGKCINRDLKQAQYYFQQAADLNDPNAQFNLGSIYSDCNYSEYNMDKAIHYFQLAANQNFTKAQYALYLLRNGFNKFDINFFNYTKLIAEQNDHWAQYNLGVLYFRGIFVEKDICKSIHYFTLSANQNNINAQYNLGMIYCGESNFNRDINKAIYYLTIAANQNFIQAQYKLGYIYFFGINIKKDVDKAIYYFTLSANQGFLYSQVFLGEIYYVGFGVKRDFQKALHYIQLAVKQQDANAQFLYGYIYFEEEYLDVTRNLDKAIFYMTKAADQKNPNAQYNLGIIYFLDKYNKKDIKKATKYFSDAAEQNISRAQHCLGVIYSESHNINKAIHYFTLSANQGYSWSQYNLGILYYDHEYGIQNISKAIHYLTLASNQNISDAQIQLGIIFLSGKYIERNIEKAVFYLTKAAENNDSDAAFLIGCIYHQGILIEQDISKAIHFYRIASSFNNGYAKNNLGVIYKNGDGDLVPKNISSSIVYFNEAIKQKQAYFSMYNLSIVYINENYDKYKEQIITLLIESSQYIFESRKLLDYLISCEKINIQFIYENFLHDLLYYDDILKDDQIKCPQKYKNISQNINESFYKGFGFNL